MLAMGTIASKLLRASARPADPARTDRQQQGVDRAELAKHAALGRRFEIAAPSAGAYGDPPPTGRQVYSFLRAVIQTADVSQSSVICSFVLMMRFLGSARLGGGSWQLAWLVAICLAQKNIDDVPLANCEFGTVLRLVAPERAETAVDTARFNDLELAMLQALRWHTHVSARVFDEVLVELGTVVEDGRREAAAAAAAQEAAQEAVQAAQQMDCTGDGDAAMPPFLKLAPATLDISSGAAGGLSANGPAKMIRPSPVTAGEFPVVTSSRSRQFLLQSFSKLT
jgi:hypothetical protein